MEILQGGGTIASAMQSMLMGLVFAAYQEFFFYDDPKGEDRGHFALRRDFTPVQVPGGNGTAAIHPAGATRSYMAVILTIGVYCLAVSFVVMAFISGTCSSLMICRNFFNVGTETKYTLWENWHVIAQIISPATEPYLMQGSMVKDDEIKEEMQRDGVHGHTMAVSATESEKWGLDAMLRQRVKPARRQNGSQNGFLMDDLRAPGVVQGGEASD